MKYIRFALIIGIVYFTIIAFFSYKDYSKKVEVKERGKKEYVRLTYIPSNCVGDINFKFLFKNKEYSKPSMSKVCKYFVGDSLQLLHYSKYKDVFLFPEERPHREISNPVSFAITAVIFLGILVLHWNIKDE